MNKRRIVIENYKNAIKEYNYLVFVLGYDLLQKYITKQDEQACDVAYEFCNDVVNEFLKSDNYRYQDKDTYSCLEEWIADNKKYIDKIWNDEV